MLRRSTLLLRPSMLTLAHPTCRHLLSLRNRIRFGLRHYCGYSGPAGCCRGRNLPHKCALSCPERHLIPEGLIKSIRIKYAPHAATDQVEMCQTFGEMEESCLLLCHSYLPEKRTSIYVHSVPPEAALPFGACPAEPLRTGEYHQHV